MVSCPARSQLQCSQGRGASGTGGRGGGKGTRQEGSGGQCSRVGAVLEAPLLELVVHLK